MQSKKPLITKVFFFVASATLLGLILAWSRAQYTHKPITDGLEHLDLKPALLRLQLSHKFEYRRQCISVKHDSSLKREKRSVFDAPGTLMTRRTKLSTGDLLRNGPASLLGVVPCDEPLVLNVPAPLEHQQSVSEELDLSQLILGVVTTLPRVIISLPEWAHWLANTDTTIVVLLRDYKDPSTAPMQKARRLALSLGIKMKLIRHGDLLPEKTPDPDSFGEAKTNFEVSLGLMEYKTPTTKWFGVMDDDTFFNSLPDIMKMLSAYDPTQPYYIGSYTESSIVHSWYGNMAFGGGGFFMTLPVMTALVENFIPCLGLAQWYGDLLWRDCMTNKLKQDVTYINGLHQLDIRRGSIAGWYESGVWPLLSLHHWKSWHRFNVPVSHLVTEVTGTESYMARFTFRDDTQDVVLTNGYSIVHYPAGIPQLDVTEATWVSEVQDKNNWSGFESEFAGSGPFRHAMNETDKLSWVLENAVQDGNTVRQFYVRRGGDISQMDSVIQLDWTEE